MIRCFHVTAKFHVFLRFFGKKCGSTPSLRQKDLKDINSYSLAKRAKDELRFLASGDVATSLYGEPLSHTMFLGSEGNSQCLELLELVKHAMTMADMRYIWPIQVNVTLDPQNTRNFHRALTQ